MKMNYSTGHFEDVKYGLLQTKCEDKMSGYWPSSFFWEFMDRDWVEVHKPATQEQGQYPAILTEQAWSLKDLLCDFWGNFSCQTWWVVPSGQDSSILPSLVANHSAGFQFILPTHGASHIINVSSFIIFPSSRRAWFSWLEYLFNKSLH